MKNNVPSQRTLKALRAKGYKAQVVERWNPFAHKRVDLFGIIDIVAMTPEGILGVQVTTMNGRSSHLKKIRESECYQLWLECGGLLELWCWEKVKNRWKERVDKFTKETCDQV